MSILPSPAPLEAAGFSQLGEGPVWDDRRQRLCWVDITRGEFHTLDPDGGSRSTWSLDGNCGFAVPTHRTDIWIAARETGVLQLDLTTGQTRPWRILDERPGFRCNDGKCDPQGRLWVGTMPTHWGAFTGTFYRIESVGDPTACRTAVGCSNGLAWAPDGSAFYYIDTLTRRIDRYDWDPAHGIISNPTVFTAFTPDQGLPDGMCVDRKGHLWVAFWGGSCVRRIDGRTGATLARLDLPVSDVTSCAFGGPDLATLFITTARGGSDDGRAQDEPLAGAVFSCRPGAIGLPVDRFAGPPA